MNVPNIGNGIVKSGEQCDPPSVQAPPPVLICPPGEVIGQDCGPNCQFVEACVAFHVDLA